MTLAHWLMSIGGVMLVISLALAGPVAGWRILKHRQREQERMWEDSSLPVELELPDDSVTVLALPAMGEDPKPGRMIVRDRLEATGEISKGAIRALLEETTTDTPLVGELLEAYEIPAFYEPEPDPEPELFFEDPLGAWNVPDYALLPEDEGLLTALATFNRLAARGVLTGAGADIDAEWESWNLVPA